MKATPLEHHSMDLVTMGFPNKEVVRNKMDTQRFKVYITIIMNE